MEKNYYRLRKEYDGLSVVLTEQITIAISVLQTPRMYRLVSD